MLTESSTVREPLIKSSAKTILTNYSINFR